MELSERLGYSAKYLVDLEQGEVSPSYRAIVATSLAFGLRASQLLAHAERLYLKHQKMPSASPPKK
jgi:transcriptional regulator with XRE-family HTH domain